ncbi:prepilin-type N-terminal cleavage/methylation domain-containing protein [Idiomarina seosinensis]|uniref:prepilin-type N-terminal cleavage/methylation domain-containing protein n=1 Tax=Idiomarina seosinensis TaxID=281739 RepID=UPI00384FDA3C
MKQKGFTLIEIIVGIVALGIALVTLTVLVFPQAPRSAEPILQARASALGQMFMNEIMAKAFDENNDLGGGYIRCGDPGPPPRSCTPPNELGADPGENRNRYDDVDDFDGLSSPGNSINDILSSAAADRYDDFGFSIVVTYSDTSGNQINSVTDYKRILVTITTPTGQDFAFSSLRGNY